MPKRYEKVEFKSFANGVSNTDFIEENAFANTFQIKVKNNKGSIHEAWAGIAKPGSSLEKDMETHNGKAYSANSTSIYTFNGTAFSVFQNLGGTEPILKMFRANEKLFAQKGTEGVFLLNQDETSFSAVGGTSTTIYPIDHTSVAVSDDGYIYFFRQNGTKTELWKTNDNFVTSTLVFDLRSSYQTGCIANINGYIYFAFHNKLMRVTKTGVEVAVTSDSGAFTFSQFNKEYTLLFSKDNKDVKVEYFDGFRKELVKKIKNAGLGDGKPFFDGQYTYLEIATEPTTSNIFKIDSAGNAFKIWEADVSSGYPSPWVIRSWNGAVIFSSANDSKWYQTTEDIFATTGYIESGIISKGEHAPIRVIARHKPLLSNTGIKIYYSKDRSGSYGASVFTNAVAGSVRTEYDFPNTIGKISFMEIKVELTSSDSTKTPEDVEFDYIYKPLGLETSV
jgi:hypothetical protein